MNVSIVFSFHWNNTKVNWIAINIVAIQSFSSVFFFLFSFTNSILCHSYCIWFSDHFCFSFLGVFHLAISYDSDNKGRRRYNLLDRLKESTFFGSVEIVFLLFYYFICHQESFAKLWHSVSVRNYEPYLK